MIVLSKQIPATDHEQSARAVYPFPDVLLIGVSLPNDNSGSTGAAVFVWTSPTLAPDRRDALAKDFNACKGASVSGAVIEHYGAHTLSRKWTVCHGGNVDTSLPAGAHSTRSTCVEAETGAAVVIYVDSTFWRYHHFSTANIVARILHDCYCNPSCFSERTLAESVQVMTDHLVMPDHMLTDEVRAISAELTALEWPAPTPKALPLISPPDEIPGAVRGGGSTARPKTLPKPQFRVKPAGIQAIRALLGGVLFPVGVLGNLREGKSTLQNLILRAASPHVASAQLAQTEFFTTSNGYLSTTKGCSCALVPHPEVPDGWILLFDFEGFGDVDKDQAYCADYDARLAAIAFAFLKSLIYNTKSGLDTYMLDRLSTFKLAADIHLKKRGRSVIGRIFSGNTNNDAASDNDVLLTLVLRDFALDGEIGGQSAAEHYRALIQDEIAVSPFASLTKMFDDIRVHTLPRPVDDARLLPMVSQLPTSKLDARFRQQFKLMVEDLFAASPRLHVPGTNSSSASTTAQGEYLASLIESAVSVVNSGKSQPLLMTAMNERVTARSVPQEHEEQLDAAVSEIKQMLPLNTHNLESAFGTLCSRIETAFAERLEATGVNTVTVAGEFKDQLKRTIEQHRRALADANVVCATQAADHARNTVLAAVPDKREFTFPTGDETRFAQWIERVVGDLRANLVGPDEITATVCDQMRNDLERQLGVYREFNATQRALAEKQEQTRRDMEQREKEAQEAMQKLGDAIESGAGLEAAKTALQQQVDGYKHQLDQVVEGHRVEMEKVTREHAETLERSNRELKDQHNAHLNQTRDELQGRIHWFEDELNKVRNRVQELQNEIDSHRRNNGGGCFPGSAHVEVWGRGRVPMRDLVVGDIVRVHDDDWEPIVGWYDRDASLTRTFLALDFAQLDGSLSFVTLTPNHLVFITTGAEPPQDSAVACQAQHVRVGDKLWDAESCMPVDIVAIRNVTCRGIYSPVPARSGTIIVDGVIASVYAKPAAFQTVDIADTLVHAISHWATYPLRTAWALGLVTEKVLGSVLHHFVRSSGPSHGKPVSPWLLPYLKLIVGSLVAVLSRLLG
ncbi:Guanylate-binding protein 5 [Allomyces javanicus]|nr:Guanylate-binding protein 5 [Allomyces javanicus]